MSRQCILCLGYENKRRKVEANTVFSLEKKILGIDEVFSSKGVHKKCLEHLLSHFPPSASPVLVKIQIPMLYAGGSNLRENLVVLCEICHEKLGIVIPPSLTFDVTRLLAYKISRDNLSMLLARA
jgi:hypothetical protein